MIKKLLMITAVLVALTAPSHARSLSWTCDGKIGHHPLSAYTAIIGKNNEDSCIFITDSPEGKRILRTCPKETQCSVEAEVNSTGSDYEIYKVVVHRTGTPALDARRRARRPKIGVDAPPSSRMPIEL